MIVLRQIYCDFFYIFSEEDGDHIIHDEISDEDQIHNEQFNKMRHVSSSRVRLIMSDMIAEFIGDNSGYAILILSWLNCKS